MSSLAHPTDIKRSDTNSQWVGGSTNHRPHCDVPNFGQTKQEKPTAPSATSPAATGTCGGVSQLGSVKP